MRVGARQNVVWLKLLRGTLAAVIVMFFVRLMVVPMNTLPSNWASHTADIPAYQAINRIMEAKPGRQLVIVRYRPDHFWGYSWINNGYDIPTQHVVWARDTEPGESNVPLLCRFKDRQVWLLIPPEKGFIPPPDRTAPVESCCRGTVLAAIPCSPKRRGWGAPQGSSVPRIGMGSHDYWNMPTSVGPEPVALVKVHGDGSTSTQRQLVNHDHSDGVGGGAACTIQLRPNPRSCCYENRARH